jgi:VWFA-related protein
MMTRWLSGWTCALLAAVSLTAQEPAKPPTFTTRTDLVLVDFIVSDKSNRPVRGLSAQDFVVKEDGKERPIVSFTAFDGADAEALTVTSGAVAGGPRADTPLRTRTPTSRPATVLLIDDGHLSPQQAAGVRPALKSLLATTAGPRGGALSLVAPWSKVSVAGLLPEASTAFAEGIDKIVGQRFEDRSNSPVSDTEALAVERGDATTLTRLANRFVALNPTFTFEVATAEARSRAIEIAYDVRMRRNVLYGVAMLSLDWLASQPGRHSLVIVSPGFAREAGDSRYTEIVTRSMRLNAPIHFIDVRGLQSVGLQSVAYRAALSKEAEASPFAWSDAAEGATALADDTGGITVGNSNDIEKGLARVIDSMSTYYILGYDAPPHAKPGFKKISVEAKTRGLRVRARRGYFAEASRPVTP